MPQNFLRFVSLVAILVLALGSEVSGQQRLEIGTVAPEWRDLVGTDDQKHSLADLKEFDFVIVCFTCNNCPYAIDYEDRLIALHKHFLQPTAGGKTVAVVAINSNDTPADQLDKMKERADQKKFPFPYLRDEEHEVAKAYQAVYTPEFFVLDRERKIRYQGALDDATKTEEVTQPFVIQAIDAISGGQEPTTTFQRARGCKIKFPRPARDL
ncbi:MAG: thioredoxin family protein [Pirellulaceae bacterium]|nr:thioredoxin family protein [Pirellulaceae bacterium]